MAPAVEPQVADTETLSGSPQKSQRSSDVVGVNVRHDKELEFAVPFRQFLDPPQQVCCSLLSTAINQPPVAMLPTAIFDPQRVTVIRWHHFDVEKRTGANWRWPCRVPCAPGSTGITAEHGVQ